MDNLSNIISTVANILTIVVSVPIVFALLAPLLKKIHQLVVLLGEIRRATSFKKNQKVGIPTLSVLSASQIATIVRYMKYWKDAKKNEKLSMQDSLFDYYSFTSSFKKNNISEASEFLFDYWLPSYFKKNK